MKKQDKKYTLRISNLLLNRVKEKAKECNIDVSKFIRILIIRNLKEK